MILEKGEHSPVCVSLAISDVPCVCAQYVPIMDVLCGCALCRVLQLKDMPSSWVQRLRGALGLSRIWAGS